MFYKNDYIIIEAPTSARSGTALQTDRWESPSSIPARAYRPRRLEFSAVFFENRLNIGSEARLNTLP